MIFELRVFYTYSIDNNSIQKAGRVEPARIKPRNRAEMTQAETNKAEQNRCWFYI
jgi:hypothetical protein